MQKSAMNRAVRRSCLYAACLLCKCMGDHTFVVSIWIYEDVRCEGSLTACAWKRYYFCQRLGMSSRSWRKVHSKVPVAVLCQFSGIFPGSSLVFFPSLDFPLLLSFFYVVSQTDFPTGTLNSKLWNSTAMYYTYLFLKACHKPEWYFFFTRRHVT